MNLTTRSLHPWPRQIRFSTTNNLLLVFSQFHLTTLWGRFSIEYISEEVMIGRADVVPGGRSVYLLGLVSRWLRELRLQQTWANLS